MSIASWEGEEGSRWTVRDPFAETVSRFREMEECIRNHRRSDAFASVFISWAICWGGCYGGLVTGHYDTIMCRSYLY